MEIKEDLSSLSFLDCKTKFILATGLGGTGREYKAYKKVFREENVEIIYWDESCIDIDSHLKKIKEKIPDKESFILCGHSMGGMLIIELLSRKSFENLKGIILVGASRKLKTEQGLNILMKLPWFCLWPLAIMFFFFIPITFFIWWGKTWETYQEMYSFLIKDGAKKIHRQYNQTLKKLGDVNSLKNPDIPLVVIRLPKDTLVDEKDLKVTEKMFQNYREKIIPSDSIHLDEKFDPITVKLIAEKKDFLQMDCKK